ncbi:hypothetical protein HOLleu_24944 [Holothuria leucospilota]|uniref:Uncharacterized protein n=1 Tax=Holothuria leucospilota TaxID=206669 RepID=A0A9Q1H344_HOLLE|nr:hypothetical protein HOLleu_24944 [Holothuria leucospilota]
MFQLGKEEQNTVSSSKNPAVALIDVLLDGDEMTVKNNLCELERISKICDMAEVNHLLNSFIRSRFRESFRLKVNIMKNGELAKEEERLLHKLLWDYSELKTISELEEFFEENYSTTISSVQEGSLDLWVKMPPTELLDKLWTDVQSGTFATNLCPLFLKNIKPGYSNENKLEIKVLFDTNVGKRIKEIISKYF